MTAVMDVIESRSLTQIEAARIFGVTQPRISDLVRGKIDRFTLDALVNMLTQAGIEVTLLVGRTAARVDGKSPGPVDRWVTSPR